jgi:hypothetical protein
MRPCRLLSKHQPGVSLMEKFYSDAEKKDFVVKIWKLVVM